MIPSSKQLKKKGARTFETDQRQQPLAICRTSYFAYKNGIPGDAWVLPPIWTPDYHGNNRLLDSKQNLNEFFKTRGIGIWIFKPRKGGSPI
jgi:hypothetical protein